MQIAYKDTFIDVKNGTRVSELFKDEIRRVGDYLGLPQDILSRQPFPGSGLALRILGEVTMERLSTLRAGTTPYCRSMGFMMFRFHNGK